MRENSSSSFSLSTIRLSKNRTSGATIVSISWLSLENWKLENSREGGRVEGLEGLSEVPGEGFIGDNNIHGSWSTLARQQ